MTVMSRSLTIESVKQ